MKQPLNTEHSASLVPSVRSPQGSPRRSQATTGQVIDVPGRVRDTGGVAQSIRRAGRMATSLLPRRVRRDLLIVAVVSFLAFTLMHMLRAVVSAISSHPLYVAGVGVLVGLVVALAVLAWLSWDTRRAKREAADRLAAAERPVARPRAAVARSCCHGFDADMCSICGDGVRVAPLGETADGARIYIEQRQRPGRHG